MIFCRARESANVGPVPPVPVSGSFSIYPSNKSNIQKMLAEFHTDNLSE